MIHRGENQERLSAKAAAAFRQAAVKVVQRARQAGTPVIVWREGRVVEISAEEMQAILANESAADRPAEATSL